MQAIFLTPKIIKGVEQSMSHILWNKYDNGQ